jgi:Fe-S cluster assembly protein SufD
MSSVTSSAASAAVPVAAGGGRHFLELHRRLVPALPGQEHGWLRALRSDGIRHFDALGFPKPHDERWKYTRVEPLERRPFVVADALCIGMDEDDLGPFLLDGVSARRMVFVNGRFVPQLSRPGRLPPGLRISSLAAAVREYPDRVEPHLGRHANPGVDGFAALNTAFLQDGAFVEVPPGVTLAEPIQVLFLSTRQDTDLVSFPRNLFVVGAASQCTIVESYATLADGANLTAAVTEVVVSEGARVEHVRVQEEGKTCSHIGTIQVHQARDSVFVCHSVSFGAQLSRTDLNARLADEGAECELNGLYMVDGRQHVDFHTCVEHEKPRGVSREYFKGILGGRSRGVFNGRVHVHPNAQKTDSQQTNKSLLLSKDAEVDTKPELEIYADDVKCSHGATVGQIDEDMLFYLRSRGIGEALARGLLTYGFAQDIVAKISVAAVRRHLEDLLVSRVPDSAEVRSTV